MTRRGATIPRISTTGASPALLAIETASSACSAAVLRGGAVVATEHRALRHGHAEVLLPMVARIVARAGLTPSEIEIVAAAIGPGGFTGIRVGLAAAHGIALAAGARLVGVSSFIAVAVRVAALDEVARDRPLLVALDSRRDDLYVQIFAPGTAKPLGPPQAVLPDALGAYAASLAGDAPLLIAGDAAAAAAAALDSRTGRAIAGDSAPDALGVAAAALDCLQDGAAPGAVRPLYLRPPEVTLPKRPAPAAAR